MIYSKEQLTEILRVHKAWLEGETDGKRATLCGANLRDADLRDANLREANLRYADLRDADLRGANLRGANLCDATLCGANLRGANLCDATLCGANLRYADLRDANLREANLRYADLRDADLRGANLRGADLRGADLRGAKNLTPLTLARLRITPSEGALVGWKKAQDKHFKSVLVKLLIPAEARRSNAPGGRKCRAEFADVLEIVGATEAFSIHDERFQYRVGERVTPHEWCDDAMQECAGGIHFYITRQEAEAH